MNPNPPPRALVVVVVAFVVPLALAACGSTTTRWDGEGVVTDLRYDDPDDWTTLSCAARDGDGNRLWFETDHHHDDAHWCVQVTERSGRDHEIEIAEPIHQRCRLGARWIQDRCQG